jgi:hypothetical protein
MMSVTMEVVGESLVEEKIQTVMATILPMHIALVLLQLQLSSHRPNHLPRLLLNNLHLPLSQSLLGRYRTKYERYDRTE